MAYKKYTAKQVREELGLLLEQKEIFENITTPIFQPSSRLLDNLKVATKMAITTEKAVCEYLVSPILTEIVLANQHIVLFSGEQLNVDRSRNLNGEIDFLFTKATNHLEVETPILCITEAKIGLIDRGIPQAAAQMYAARLKNEQEGKPLPIIYGAVTDGKTWRFLKLENQLVYTDLTILYLDNLPLLLGTLQWIINFYD
jgi:hypothetical protein